jgi:hypothetical protein
LTPVVKESDALLISDEPLVSATKSVAAKPTVTPQPVTGATVQGFGRSVPLVLALQQIVPSSYRYSFGEGTTPGMRVDWSGGKMWKDVVADIARHNNMNVEIVSNVIAFRRHGAPIQPSAEPIASVIPVVAEPQPVVPSPWIAEDKKIVATEKLAEKAEPALPLMWDEPKQADLSDPMEMPMSLLEKPKTPEPKAPEFSEIVEDTAKDEDSPLNITAFELPEKIEPVKPDVKETKVAKKEQPSKVGKFFDDLFDFDRRSPVMNPVKDKKIAVRDGDDVAPVVQMAETEVPMVMDPAPIKSEEMEAVSPPASAPQPAMEIASVQPEPATVAPVVTEQESAPVVNTFDDMREWQGQKGETLRQTMTRWAEESGVSLVWSSEYDYPLQTDVRIQSSYADAVRTMLAGFSKAKPRPLARLFRNQSVGAQPVLVVETDKLAQ